MSPAPALSVVVTTFNVVHWIDECLTSVLDGGVADSEVIVVDDGSDDGTWEIVEEYAARDPRVRAIRSPLKGGAAARNHGVVLAHAPFVAFVDGDDIVPPGAHGALLDAARTNRAELAVGDFLKFSSTRTWSITRGHGAYRRAVPATTLAEQPRLIRNRACWNRVFSRDFLLREDIVFPEVVRSNDIAPMTRALSRARRISVVPRVVYLYRTRPGGTSMTAAAARAAAFESYLQQETACARMVAEQESGVQHEYWWMVLRSDAWNHLRGYLAERKAKGDGRDAEGAEDEPGAAGAGAEAASGVKAGRRTDEGRSVDVGPRADATGTEQDAGLRLAAGTERDAGLRLAAALDGLLALCPATAPDTRSFAQRMVFELARRGEWRLASVVATFDDLPDLDPASRRELALAWCAALALLEWGEIEAEPFRRAVLGALSLGVFEGRPEQLRRLREDHARMAARPAGVRLLPWEARALAQLEGTDGTGARTVGADEGSHGGAGVVEIRHGFVSVRYRAPSRGAALVIRGRDIRVRRNAPRGILSALTLRPGDEVYFAWAPSGRGRPVSLVPVPVGRVTESSLERLLSPLVVASDPATGGLVVRRRSLPEVARGVLRRLRG